MSAAWAQSENERTTANLIRIGVVAEVALQHEDGPRAKMRMGGLLSDWLPWAVSRAGGTRTASTPTPGEQRLVFSPCGDTAQGVIGPAIYQDDYASPSTTADQEVVVFPDGTRAQYDSASNTLQVDVAGAGNVIVNCQQATVKAATSVTLDTPSTHCTGALVVEGNATFNGGAVTHGGKNIGKDHTHAGVTAGSATSGPPV